MQYVRVGSLQVDVQCTVYIYCSVLKVVTIRNLFIVEPLKKLL